MNQTIFNSKKKEIVVAVVNAVEVFLHYIMLKIFIFLKISARR